MRRIINYFHEVLIKISIAHCLGVLAQLQHTYFACYKDRDYFSKQSVYEKEIYKKCSKWLISVSRARFLLNKNKKVSAEWRVVFSRVEHLSEVIFSLNQLRFRVSQHAIYEICSFEMQALDRTSAAAFKDVTKMLLWDNNSIPSLELLDCIHSFEAISNRVLRVASPEPIVFLFFIQDLYALNDEINKLYEKII